MNFERIAPSADLAKFVEWYWCAESDDTSPQREKIIPDGYPEFIFHYGNPYRIGIGDHWYSQGPVLFGGQLRQYFFLENTGKTGTFGITFKPSALTHLFGVDMHPVTDQVVNLTETIKESMPLQHEILSSLNTRQRITIAEGFLKKFITLDPDEHVVDRALRILRLEKGLVSMQSLSDQVAVGDRQLQRLFQRYVGLTPKFYARIIRFNTVFGLLKQGGASWADVVHTSGYYDQSHFIRNFKTFTGEDPTAYPFDRPTITNFFTGKTGSRKSDLYNTPKVAAG